MSLKERSYSALVVSGSEKFNTAFAALLPPSEYQPAHIAASASEGKRCLAERSFDFVIIDLPLPGESGIRFALDCCRSPATVVFVLARNDVYEELYDKMVSHGIFSLPKPTSRAALAQALRWMASARERLRALEEKTLSVEERMEEIRTVNRAKFLLISELKMTEPAAHHYIEKYAMDRCISKKDAAQDIIQKYS